jgi:putative transposase
MNSQLVRQNALALADQGLSAGLTRLQVAAALGISEPTLRRWRANPQGDQRPNATRPLPQRTLSLDEEEQMIAVCNSPALASKPPAQIVAHLADQGRYLASERTIYRVLKRRGQSVRRGRARAPAPRKKAPTHTASRPHEVFVWDITWLPGPIRGQFFRFQTLMDLFSRKIIASEVWETENAENSCALLRRAALAENLAANNFPTILHGDNGSPLKAGTVLALMHTLGIKPSHSRPRVSNDNAHAESFFRTAKYHPSLPPEGFATIEEAREWASNLVDWYNNEHRHSSIGWVTPSEKHEGKDRQILAKRRELYAEEKLKNPSRWISGKCRDWKEVTSTTLNPISNKELERLLKKSA